MSKRRRLVELGKDLLIVLLTLSALWLAGQNQMLVHITRALKVEETAVPQTGGIAPEDRSETVRPLRIAARLPGDSDSAICGILYDETACDSLFGQVAGMLSETLSEAETPEGVTRNEWEELLQTQPGLMMDFQGAIPLSVLSGWLSGNPIALDSPVRRVVLAVESGTVTVTYRDEGNGFYRRIRSQVANPDHLLDILGQLTENGAFYAFQSEEYAILDRDTLLPADSPQPMVYTASNPVEEGSASLESLMENLGLSVNANGIYRGADSEWVARSGGDTLRLSDDGVAVYEAGEGTEDRFHLGGGQDPSLYDQVEACRRLAVSALSGRIGEGRLGLLSVRETEQGLEVRFGVSLNACPVVASQGNGARFLIRDGRIERFEMVFRSYVPAEEVTQVLPPRQALAALEAQQLSGKELLMVYNDTGSERVEAGWAAGRGAGEE